MSINWNWKDKMGTATVKAKPKKPITIKFYTEPKEY